MDTWKKLGQALVVLILLAPLSVSWVDAQSPNPIVSFEANKYQVSPNETVLLTWNMKNIDEASLIWPGAAPETLYGPGSKAVTFPSPGDYSFTLRALYGGGEKQVWIIFHVREPQRPQPVCTPPRCPAGAVLRCPEGRQCPGGCGVVCVGPTHTWRVRGTVRDHIVGAPLGAATVTCQGGSIAASTQTPANGVFELTWDAPGEAKPDGKCTAQLEGFNPAEVTLDSPGAGGTHQVQLALKPVIPQGNGEWAINYVASRKAAELGRPLGAIQPISICARKFENGAMFWRSGDKQSAIVSLMAPTGRFYLADDTWDQRSNPPCSPPNQPGLYLPGRGLGWVWCQNQGVREGLGYSVEPQEVCDSAQLARMQDYPAGRLVWMQSWNQVIYLHWSGGLWYPYDFSP